LQQRDDLLVWMDLEMTGLDPETCHVVQAAIILTDHQLEQIGSPLELTIWQPDSILDTMTPYVHAMHEKSGLLEGIRRSDIDLSEAEQQIMEVLSKNCTYRTARLAGNSIGQDRLFVRKYMPAIDNYLHYRQIDVSSIKELGLWWYNAKHTKPSEGKHTALFDIRQSIEEMRFFRDKIFK